MSCSERSRARDLPLALILLLVLFGATDGQADLASSSIRPELSADNEGALREVVIHFDPRAEREVAPSYRDLLRALDTSVTIFAVVEKDAHASRLRQLLQAWAIDPRRMRAVVVGRPITTWSRDRYSLVRHGARRILLVPPRPNEGAAARQNDWLAPFAIVRTAGPGVEVLRTPLIFDGGDLLATGRHVFATALLLERNRGGALGDPHLLRDWLRAQTGRKPVLIGERAEEVPGHHIGMFVTALEADTLLVGDPGLGLSLLEGEASLPLPVDRSPETRRRFERVAEELRAHGFRVLPTPLVPLSDGLTYVTYNNAAIERRSDGRLHAYLPQFGLPRLDAAGRAVYAREGVVVHPIDVRGIYRWNGTVRCLINVLRRDASPSGAR